MSEKEKAIKVIKEIRQKEEKAAEQAKFCREHNFNLESSLFSSIESELRQVCRLIQNEFDTGYIS